MKAKLALCFALVVACCAAAYTQQGSAPKAPKTPYYVDPTVLNVGVLLPTPPADDSKETKAELAEEHRIERTRTAAQVAQAKADEAEEDIFVFQNVLGKDFTPDALPLTAELGTHVKNEQSVVGNQLKTYFQRQRPYQTDTTLHPVCEVKTTHDSYPSGHGLTGYLEALTLAEIAPEKKSELLARADDYAHNRVVCGVHYPSDIEASRKVAYVVFGYMLATPKFQKDLKAARMETRAKLGLPPIP